MPMKDIWKSATKYVSRINITLIVNGKDFEKAIDKLTALQGIQLVPDEDPQKYNNCFNYVLRKEGETNYTGIDKLVNSLTLFEEGNPGDIIWYFSPAKYQNAEGKNFDMIVTHAGIVQEDGSIISKYGENMSEEPFFRPPIINHEVWRVPLGAGNKILYSERPSQEFIDKYVNEPNNQEISFKELSKEEKQKNRLYVNSLDLTILPNSKGSR